MKRTPRFGTRVFTKAEREYCDGKGVVASQSYAARFAAKEAFLKAIGTGWRGKITWLDIEVVSDNKGAPLLKIHGEAQKILKNCGANRVHLSISHTSDLAIAEVILEKS